MTFTSTSNLIASKDKIDATETFNLIDLGNNKAGLELISNGRYVCAENQGASPLVVDRLGIGPWETFIVEKVPNGFAFKA